MYFLSFCHEKIFTTSIFFFKKMSQLYTLTEYIQNVLANYGSYTNYTDTLIENNNIYPSLSTKESYSFFQNNFDKNGRITTDDVQGRMKVPVKLVSFDSQLDLSLKVGNICLELGSPESLCSCFRIANAYHQLVQTYIADLEQYAVNMAIYTKAHNDYNKWLKTKTGSPPFVPNIPENPIVPDTPAIPCCEERFSTVGDIDVLERDLNKCLSEISKNIVAMEKPKLPKTQIAQVFKAPSPQKDYSKLILTVVVLIALIILNAIVL